MTRNDLIALLTQVAGFCGLAAAAGFSPAIDAVFPGYGAKTLAVLGLIGLVTGTVLRVLSNPSPPSGTASVVVPVADNKTQSVTATVDAQGSLSAPLESIPVRFIPAANVPPNPPIA